MQTVQERQASFEDDVKAGGVPFAIRQRWPGLEVNDKGTHEKLQELVQLRQRYINDLARIYGLTFTEAEALADGKGAPGSAGEKVAAVRQKLGIA